MTYRIASSALLSIMVVAAFARADSRPHVFEAPNLPDDQRLHDIHDVDHPVLFNPDFKDRAAWEKHARQVREQVLVAEGLWPLPPKTPLNPVIHGKIDRDDYTIEKVFFASYPGHYVSGNLYRPKNKSGRLPGVLCPHGHWPDGRFYERTNAEARKQIDEGAEKTMEGARYPLQARCAMLARMGCVVFHYDMVGYADSKPIEHRTGFTDAESILRLQSFMGLQTWNSIRSLDFLTSLPDVDTSRIAVTGASGGGTQTFTLCAVDDRPSVAFPAVMVGEAMQGGCVCENAPLLRVNTDNVEIAALFAPKPLAMSAANDWTIALETQGLPKLKQIYKLFGDEKLVTGKHFSFEHNYNQVSREMMYNWFNQHLKLGWAEKPVREKPFIPVPPQELSVYDAEHPRPSDASDAPTLRKYMTETSDRQLEELWKNDREDYRRMVRTALRVMVNDDLPSADNVVVGHSSGPQSRDGLVIETGTLSRRGAGEAVPFVSLVPADWGGNVVVWVDPKGKASLFDDGGQPTAQVKRLLDRHSAVICADLFLTGEFNPSGQPGHLAGKAEYEKQDYAGFLYGYNRSVLAQQVHDLLSTVCLVRHWKGTKSIDLIAVGQSGPAALLARALAGDSLRRAAIDLNRFDFDQVKDGTDPMMLPGALKYGGICGFAALRDSGPTLLANAPDSATRERLSGTTQITSRDHATAEEMMQWLFEGR